MEKRLFGQKPLICEKKAVLFKGKAFNGAQLSKMPKRKLEDDGNLDEDDRDQPVGESNGTSLDNEIQLAKRNKLLLPDCGKFEIIVRVHVEDVGLGLIPKNGRPE